MPTTNLYFNNFSFSREQTLLEDLIIESIKIYGIEVYYMPRTLVSEDNLFGENAQSTFSDAIPLEMYIKSVDGFQGEGDFLSKFGLEIRDEMVLSVARRRFEEELPVDDTSPVNEDGSGRPAEGDLIYFPLNGKIFEVKFVEHESVFYQMGTLQTYDLTLELFEYSHEVIDTGFTQIDRVEEELSPNYIFLGQEVFLPIADAIAQVVGQFVTSINVLDGGEYTAVPTVTIADPPDTIGATANVVVSNTGFITNFPIGRGGRGYVNQPTVSVEGIQAIEGYARSNRKFGEFSYKLGVDESDKLFTRGTSVSDGYFNFHVNVPSTNNVVYGKVFEIEDTGPDWYVEVSNTSSNTYSLDVYGNATLYANNLSKDEWYFFSVRREEDAGVPRLSLYQNGVQVATERGASEPTSLYERYIKFTNTRSGNVYIDHISVDSNLNANLDLYVNTAVSTSGTLVLLNDFENAVTNTFSEVTTANVNASGAVSSIVLPTIPGNEIISANVLIQDAPEGIPAQATAVIANNRIVSITITNQGSGYTTAPSVTITGQVTEGQILLEDGFRIIDDSYRVVDSDPQANNLLFEEQSEDIIDFTEFNPFSEGDRW